MNSSPHRLPPFAIYHGGRKVELVLFSLAVSVCGSFAAWKPKRGRCAPLVLVIGGKRWPKKMTCSESPQVSVRSFKHQQYKHRLHAPQTGVKIPGLSFERVQCVVFAVTVRC